MKKKIRVGIIFGGQSAEHEVSLQSGKNIIEAIDKGKYEVVPIGIDKSGRWYMGDGSRFLLNANNPKLIALNRSDASTRPVGLISSQGSYGLVDLNTHESVGEIDVFFPVLHGPMGEDGTIQGLLKLANVPFVGAQVLGSAVGMDKDVMKRLLRDAGIPVAKFLIIQSAEQSKFTFETVNKRLGLPFFIKPANLGSSIGVSKVKSANQFARALKEAFQYDHKILVEEYIKGREIECSVLGNDQPIASLPGEVSPHHEFYSYEAKYIDEHGSALKIPAKLPQSIVKKVQELAIKTFQVLSCEGMARVDFFLRGKNEVMVNEINTIPGFTNISMYPKLWEASGVSYPKLIDRLIQLAFERFRRDQKLTGSYFG